MSDKTEAPTGQRISDARAEGQVAFSREVVVAAGLLASIWLLGNTGGNLVMALKEILSDMLIHMPDAEPTGLWVQQILYTSLVRVVPSLGMIMLSLMVTGIAATLVQTGFLWASKRLGFHFDKLNPLVGLKRIFSAHGLMEFAKALLKLLIVGWVAYSFLESNASGMMSLGQTDFASAMRRWVDLAMALAWRVAGAYLVLALADYTYQRWSYMRSMRMTKEEVKEDFKRQEGDPIIKGRIRSQQRRMARMRMMANVRKADVVITNPTHLAVAIEYKPEAMNAPKLVAKGADRVAERIVELAKSNNVPVIQNIPVARALYRTVDLDQEIPPEMYIALAEILAYVYRIKGKVVAVAQERPVVQAPSNIYAHHQ